MKKPFKPVPAPFAGGSVKNDEQATQDAFVEYVGGRHKAEQLSKLWQNSYASGFCTRGERTKNQVFRDKALREGFSNEDVDAFFCL